MSHAHQGFPAERESKFSVGPPNFETPLSRMKHNTLSCEQAPFYSQNPYPPPPPLTVKSILPPLSQGGGDKKRKA